MRHGFVIARHAPRESAGRNQREDTMKYLATVASMAAGLMMGTALSAQDITVGVSWSNFQEERWKTDEAAIKAKLDELGARYISADAQASAAKQLTDVEALIAQGADALIILGHGQGRHRPRRGPGRQRRHPGGGL
jgi:ABC-type xylose transport system substrate-binding protein